MFFFVSIRFSRIVLMEKQLEVTNCVVYMIKPFIFVINLKHCSRDQPYNFSSQYALGRCRLVQIGVLQNQGVF